MSNRKFYRLAMRVPATLLVLIGAAHLILPTYGYNPETASAWSEPVKDYFLYMATYMTAAFLLTLSLLTFIYANKSPSRTIAWFATLSTFLWIARFFLEFQFPIGAQLFIVETPPYLLMALFGIIALFYALSSSLIWGTVLIRK